MPRLTDEQIQDAKNITLLEYFRLHDPASLKQTKDRTSHAQHDSFIIDNGNGQWFWNSKGIGGKNAIDYITKIEGKSFIEAVRQLVDDGVQSIYKPSHVSESARKTEPTPKSLVLPKPAETNDNVLNYLKNRGISQETAQKCISLGLIYETKDNSLGDTRAVFVGYNQNNEPKYAAERSLNKDIKKDLTGSDKTFSFLLPANDPNSDSVAVFESPIDAISHAELYPKFDGYRLSLAGTAPKALNAFLERNPNTETILLCLDNDKAGQLATKQITTELSKENATKNIKILNNPPFLGKDYNELLKEQNLLRNHSVILPSAKSASPPDFFRVLVEREKKAIRGVEGR